MHIVAWIVLRFRARSRETTNEERKINYLGFVLYELLINRSELREEAFDAVSYGLDGVFDLFSQTLGNVTRGHIGLVQLKVGKNSTVFLHGEELSVPEPNGGLLDPRDSRAGFMFHCRLLRGNAPGLRGGWRGFHLVVPVLFLIVLSPGPGVCFPVYFQYDLGHPDKSILINSAKRAQEQFILSAGSMIRTLFSSALLTSESLTILLLP